MSDRLPNYDAWKTDPEADEGMARKRRDNRDPDRAREDAEERERE